MRLIDPKPAKPGAASGAAPSDESGPRETGAAHDGRESRGPARRSLATGIVFAGKYRLERLLRRGGMGSVWVATHLGLQSPVAIKFLSSRVGADVPDAGDETARARFEREASAAARLRMANIVQVLDYGVDDDVPYLVMELLEGEDLGARLDRVGSMSIAEAAPILSAVARALQRAHDMGLVHRDLKPENIFLAKEGDDEVPKILDFGVAKAMRGDDKRVDSTTSEGTVVGTPYYISPEQAVGRTDIDHRSDLWSLGVIAFRMITGERPFKAELLLEVVVEICAAPIPAPTSIVPSLPAEVDAFMEKALAREAEQRFGSAKELASAFAALAGPDAATSGEMWRTIPGARSLTPSGDRPSISSGNRSSSPSASRSIDASGKRSGASRVWIAVAALGVVGVAVLVGWWWGHAPSSAAQPSVPSAPSVTATGPATPPSAAVPPSAVPSATADVPGASATSSGEKALDTPPKGGIPHGTAKPAVKPASTRKGREVGY